MSYDIEILFLSGEGDALEQARDLASQEEDPAHYPEEAARRQRVVEGLLALHPSMKMWPDDRGFAYGCGVGPDDPDCDIPDLGLGVDRCVLSFSYSADEDVVFQLVERLLEVFERHGYVAYDPQLDQLISSAGGLGGSASRLQRTRGAVIDMLEGRGETVIPPRPSGERKDL